MRDAQILLDGYIETLIRHISMWPEALRPQLAKLIVKKVGSRSCAANALFEKIGDFSMNEMQQKSLALQAIRRGVYHLLLTRSDEPPIDFDWLDQEVALAMIDSDKDGFEGARTVAKFPRAFTNLSGREILERLAIRHPNLLEEFAQNFYKRKKK